MHENPGRPVETETGAHVRTLPPLFEAMDDVAACFSDAESSELFTLFAESSRTARHQTSAMIAADPQAYQQNFNAWIRAGAPTCSQQSKRFRRDHLSQA